MISKAIAFFKLVRWFHELLAILPFVSLYFVTKFFAKKYETDCNLSGSNFIFICLGVQLLLATGCVLNDLMDRDIDKINKPQTHIVGNTISLANAWRIFYVLTFFVLLISCYISCFIFSEWAIISTCVYILSLLYNIYLKRSPLFGNVLMAILTSFIPLVLYFFAKDCIQSLNNEKLYVLIGIYALFPFLIIIPRELSLDISDIEGDRSMGCNTLPILIGIKKSRIVVVLFLLLILLLSIPVVLKYDYLKIWIIITDVLLLIYLFKFKSTETRLDYIKIGRFLWFIMILGLIGFTIATVI